MGHIVRFLLAAVLVCVLTALSSPPATAESGAGDRAAMQALVDSQIDAFRRDDESGAYAYASPGIQSMYPSPGLFMQMVRQAFQPVYRPQQYSFGATRDGPNGPLLDVYVTGPDGNAYVAEYSFQQQPDGSWRISGCRLIRDDSPTI